MIGEIMKKSTIAKILMCIMFPSMLMLGGCVDSGSDDGGLNDNPQLKDMVENTQDDPDYYKKFTYTYYDSDGKQLKTSAFKEAYVFVDPGKDGSYFDHKTGASVGFAELASRELTTLSNDIAYRLMAVYGDDSIESSREINENIKVIETGETITSQYKLKNIYSDSLDVYEETDKTIYNANYTNGVYRLDDMYTLALLSVKGGSQASDDTYFDYFSQMFSLKNAISGGGFNVEFNSSNPNWFGKTGSINSDRQWNIKNGGINSVDALAVYIYDKLLSIKTGGSNDIYSIDHLGFTISQIANIKSMILSDVIGTGNVNYDTVALENIKANSSDIITEQGCYVTAHTDIVEGQTMFGGNTAFLTALNTYIAEKESSSIAESKFKSDIAYDSYVNMFAYKAYNLVVDKIVDLALNSNEYDAEGELVDSTKNPLYFLYPRVAVMIVPGAYLGGEGDEDDDYLEEGEDGYDYDEIADKSGYDENFEPATTMEPYLPSWKIISVVYKPDAVYGINNVTEERIDGVVMSDLDIAFVGEEGYTSIIESSVSYVANGNQILNGDDARVQDILVDNVCPDMTASSYPDNHYLTLLDMTKMEKDQLLNCVLGAYNGFDFVEESKKEGSGLSIYRVGTTDSTVYYNRVDGLPYSSSFMKYVEDSEGNLILDMSTCLGTNYVKIDVNFLQIEDSQKNNVTASVKRTNLGIISIEPQTAS